VLPLPSPDASTASQSTWHWREDDFSSPVLRAPLIDDPWSLAPGERPTPVALNDNASAWRAEDLGEAPAPVPPTFEDWAAPLPQFDPDAGRRPDSLEFLAAPRTPRGAEFKARMAAALSAIATLWERKRAVRAWTELFEDWPTSSTYHAWQLLAPAIESANVVELVLDLRRTWDSNPSFWMYRPAPNAAPRQHETNRTQLSWRAALRMAEAVPDVTAEELLNTDLIMEWYELDEPCPGFWSFASYVEVIATGDEAETAALASLRALGRARIAERTLATRTTKVARCNAFGSDSAIRVAELSDRYKLWARKRAAAEDAQRSSNPRRNGE